MLHNIFIGTSVLTKFYSSSNSALKIFYEVPFFKSDLKAPISMGKPAIDHRIKKQRRAFRN